MIAHLHVFLPNGGRFGTLVITHDFNKSGFEFFRWQWVAGLEKRQGIWDWLFSPDDGEFLLFLFENDNTAAFGYLKGGWDFPKFADEPAQPWFARPHHRGEGVLEEVSFLPSSKIRWRL